MTRLASIWLTAGFGEYGGLVWLGFCSEFLFLLQDSNLCLFSGRVPPDTGLSSQPVVGILSRFGYLIREKPSMSPISLARPRASARQTPLNGTCKTFLLGQGSMTVRNGINFHPGWGMCRQN
jgi:hypothetical protein